MLADNTQPRKDILPIAGLRNMHVIILTMNNVIPCEKTRKIRVIAQFFFGKTLYYVVEK